MDSRHLVLMCVSQQCFCLCFPFQISDKTSQERDRGGCGVVGGGGSCSSVGGAGGGERSVDRPRTSPSQRLMSTHHHHHHLGYSLLPAQYNLPYAAGKPLFLTSCLFDSIPVPLPTERGPWQESFFWVGGDSNLSRI